MNRSSLLASAVMFGALALSGGSHAAVGELGSRTLTSVQLAQSMPYSIRNVQVLLNELGYNVGRPDGKAGPGTKNAIRAFQTDNRLPASGEPSRALFDQLQKARQASAGGGQQQATTQASATATASTPAAQPSTDMVVGIQQQLRTRGYTIPTLSGRMDTETTAAIREYQSDAGLTVNGMASESLLANLQAAPRGTTGGGFSRTQIIQVQQGLNSRGYDAGPEDGSMGPKVKSAIRTFQADNGLPVTGEVSQTLISQLQGSGGTQTAGTGGNATGSGSEEYQIESHLQRLGYDVGRVDGVIDSKSRSAIQQYQQQNNMKVNGQPSRRVLASLQAQTGGQGQGQGTGTQTQGTGSQMQGTGQASGMAGANAQVSRQTVTSIEQGLKDKGYNVGTVDGQIDVTSREAITAFIRHNQLNMSNEPSEALLAAIRSSQVTAQQGNQQDLVQTGVNALGGLLQKK